MSTFPARLRLIAGLTLTCVAVAACASLGSLGVLAPTLRLAEGEGSELRLVGPSLQHPLGGATLRLNTRVDNPNPVGITLTRLSGTLILEGLEAADADFPLGVPLAAGGSTVVPLNLTVGFANLPRLADALAAASRAGAVDYSLRGTLSVDAGLLGQPVFGPMTLLEGSVRARR